MDLFQFQFAWLKGMLLFRGPDNTLWDPLHKMGPKWDQLLGIVFLAMPLGNTNSHRPPDPGGRGVPPLDPGGRGAPLPGSAREAAAAARRHSRLPLGEHEAALPPPLPATPRSSPAEPVRDKRRERDRSNEDKDE